MITEIMYLLLLFFHHNLVLIDSSIDVFSQILGRVGQNDNNFV